MKMYNNIYVSEKILQKDMLYNDQVVVTYKIKYPCFTSHHQQCFLDQLNQYYFWQAQYYIDNDIAKIYDMAVDYLKMATINNFPFHPSEVVTEYNITYNRDCIISLYFDRYEYTGGAHGETLRSSDTWDLQNHSNILLSELMRDIPNYQEYIINNIISTIEQEIYQGNNVFFDNYEELVRESFREYNYYLTDEGIVIYFMQYDIAPYSSGIQTFIIS